MSFQVRNTGKVAGDTVPQVYLGAPTTQPAGAKFAPTALAAYARIHLAAGRTTTVSVHVPLRQLQYWSTTGGWTTATGPRAVIIGTTATTPTLQRNVTITS